MGADKKQPSDPTRSRARAVRAMCWECMGEKKRREDCGCPACPLYAFSQFGRGEPDYWWTAPAADWGEFADDARRVLFRGFKK